MEWAVTFQPSAAILALGATPSHAARIFVSNERDNTVTVIDLDTLETLATIKTGERPRGIITTPDHKEVLVCADQVRFFAGAARMLEGRAAGEYLEGFTSYVRREPIGIVGQVTPWNYPFMMAIWKIAPALAAGNTCVVKPSPELKAYVETLVKRADAIKNRTVKPDEDNMLAVTNDGRKAALDIRLVDASSMEAQDGKVSQCAGNVFGIVELIIAGEQRAQRVICA